MHLDATLIRLYKALQGISLALGQSLLEENQFVFLRTSKNAAFLR